MRKANLPKSYRFQSSNKAIQKRISSLVVMRVFDIARLWWHNLRIFSCSCWYCSPRSVGWRTTKQSWSACSKLRSMHLSRRTARADRKIPRAILDRNDCIDRELDQASFTHDQSVSQSSGILTPTYKRIYTQAKNVNAAISKVSATVERSTDEHPVTRKECIFDCRKT